MIKVLPFLIISFLLAVFLIIMTIAAVMSPGWVTFEDFMDNDYTWGLVTCSDCPDESKNMEWDCWK